MLAPRTLAFSGSTREGSLNKRLLRVAVELARQAGSEVTVLDLREYALPLYDGDDEAKGGVPAPALELKRLFRSHHALLISSPEYNSGYSGVLKNTIDWVSRPVPDEAPFEPFEGKVAGLLAASPGSLGGLRGLVPLRMLLANLRFLVIAEQFAPPKADAAFDENGELKDPRQRAGVETVVRRLVDVTRRQLK